MTGATRWLQPRPGDILWCRFPEDLQPSPGPKPRPAIVLAVGRRRDEITVRVAFGTSRKTDRLHRGEFLIGPADGDAYAAAGLSYPTKFNLAKCIELPYTAEWFAAAPGTPFGQNPKLGLLHPSLVRRARAAWEANRQ